MIQRGAGVRRQERLDGREVQSRRELWKIQSSRLGLPSSGSNKPPLPLPMARAISKRRLICPELAQPLSVSG